MARSCPICGKTMLQFQNPYRLLCPNESSHKKILAGGLRLGKSPRKKNKGKK